MFKNVLDERNITCYALAKKSGVSYTAVNELYRGERAIDDCSFKNVFAIAKALEISLEKISEECKKRAIIPSELHNCFWDVDPNEIDLLKHKKYIIPRLLQYGGYEGFMFVIKNYTYEELKEVAKTSRKFAPKQAYFLMNYFNFKKSDMAYFTKREGEWR